MEPRAPEAVQQSATPPVSTEGRWVDRIDPRVVKVLTVAGFTVPVLAYLYLLVRYSVNTISFDQWDDIPVIHRSYVHLLDWSSLWSPHNENRIFFPNLIVVGLAHTVHFNVQVEEYLGAGMLFVATFLIMLTHKRRSPGTPWLYYCPVAILTLSFVQWENTLWGFQMAWYLVYLCMALALFLLDQETVHWWTVALAIAAAVVGSFSSLQGLIIWPVGLVLLYHRRRSMVIVGSWLASAVATTALYFRNFHGAAGPTPTLALKHLWVAFQFLLYAVGEVVGLPNSEHQTFNRAVLVFGLVIVVVALIAVGWYGIRRDEHGAAPVGVALICFGLLFAVMVTQGRLAFGPFGAGQSRYATFDLLILVGVYLTFLERPPRFGRSSPPTMVATPEPMIGGLIASPVATAPRSSGVGARVTLRCLRWVVAVAIIVQVGVGTHEALPRVKANYVTQVDQAAIIRNIDHTPDVVVQNRLYYARTAHWLRMQVQVLREHHLSLFDDGSGSP